MTDQHALSDHPATTTAHALPIPSRPYDEALAEQYALLLHSENLVALIAREFHSLGMINGYHSAGAISTAMRGWDMRNVQEYAERIRERMIGGTDVPAALESLLISTLSIGLSATIIERKA